MRSIFLVACLAVPAFGQNDRASIIGIVSDPDARLVQHARVEAKNIETQQVYVTESGDTGALSHRVAPGGNL